MRAVPSAVRHPVRRGLAVLCALCSLACPRMSVASEPDWSDYAALLSAHVHAGARHGVTLHLVDYAGLAADPRLARARDRLAAFPRAALTTREERIAYYVNAYNLLALDMVARGRPPHSIKDLGNLFWPVWRRRAGVLDGAAVSLDDIEHEWLRPLGEPRIHFAIVCASISCPDLRTEPYTAAALSAQLDAQAQDFLANPRKGCMIVDDRGAVRVSAIFDWFERDFAAAGGVRAFVARYRPLPATATLRADLPYDWDLNAQ